MKPLLIMTLLLFAVALVIVSTYWQMPASGSALGTNIEVATPTITPSPTIHLEQVAIEAALNTATIRELYAQKIIATIKEETISTKSAEIFSEHQPGGIMILGNVTEEEMREIVEWINSLDFAIKPFIIVDQEGGDVKRLSEDPNPGPAILGKRTPSATCDAYAETTTRLNNLGIHVNFGIIADIAEDKKAYIASRSFGSDANKVSRHVAEAVRCSQDILTVVKHFPGHGITNKDTHFSVPELEKDWSDLMQNDLIPFETAINAGVSGVMIGHFILEPIDKLPVSLSTEGYSKLRDMGFNGITFTDDLVMLEKNDYEREDILIHGIQSGADMLVYTLNPIEVDQLFKELYQYAEEEATEASEIDKSVSRILHMKYNYGLLE